MATLWSLFFVLVCGQNLLNEPESVVYDVKYDRYLVSNCGDGSIVQVKTLAVEETEDNASHIYEYFNTELSIALGMHILGDTLYVSSDIGVVGIDLATGKKIKTISILEAKLLNDITSDNDGFLYVSDSEAKMVFKADPINLTYSILVPGGIVYPNGLLYEENTHCLLVCSSQFFAPIYEVDLNTGIMTVRKKTTLSNIDGMARDKWGNVYVSSWTTNAVYRFAPGVKKKPVKISKGHNGPADICINPITQVLVIPNFNSNKLDHLQIRPVSDK